MSLGMEMEILMDEDAERDGCALILRTRIGSMRWQCLGWENRGQLCHPVG